MRDVHELDYKNIRVHGTSFLYDAYRGAISRRNLEAIVEQCRLEHNRNRRAALSCVQWLVPGSVWAMDDSHWQDGLLHSVMDLASTYRFDPLFTARLLPGKAVAENLTALFLKYGAPLVMKMDNGSNLWCRDVLEVLEAHDVIALPSPPYYPQYNGKIERSQADLKRASTAKLSRLHEHQFAASLAAHELNMGLRPCLNGRSATELFAERSAEMNRFNRQERRRAYRWIIKATRRMLSAAERENQKPKLKPAYRVATETWLQQNEIINIKTAGVLPLLRSPIACY